MFEPLLLMAAMLADPPLRPLLDELRCFPPWLYAVEQIPRYDEHIRGLRRLEGIRGYEGGRWQQAIAEAELAREYWQNLKAAWFARRRAPDQAWAHLRYLKELIGPERYRNGWCPPLLRDPRDTGPPPRRRSVP
jgi:hypothetical protein